MTIKHNQQLQKNHFRKDWQRRVRTHFDQAGKKTSRRIARQAKAAAVAPRPVDRLRPIVRCPTIRYNRKVRAGRGFSLAELKAAGLSRKFAHTVGISIDARRQNLSEEGLAANVARLKEYKERLIVFPRRTAVKKGDTSYSELPNLKIVKSIAGALPITATDKSIGEISKSELPKPVEGGAYTALRRARTDARLVGVRERRAKEKAEAEAAKK
jgi:large subunit ribosomal protein L13e